METRSPARDAPAVGEDPLGQRYLAVRATTESLCEGLETEDYVVQTMPDVSPAKWHLAHTSWFFETFVLEAGLPGYRAHHPQYRYLFNSYYNTVGPQFSRPERGHLSRPTVAEVYAYRRNVDAAMQRLLAAPHPPEVDAIVELGLQHEQQHQELLLTDLKHVFASNPLHPVYRAVERRAAGEPPPLTYRTHEGALYEIGHAGAGFAFDNEAPRHGQFVQPFGIGTRLVTNGEYVAFISAGGYARPEFWLSDGWLLVQQRRWNAPLYWEERDGAWWHMTLGGLRPVALDEPVVHVSYYEADAFARWSGGRLPRETEWEVAAAEAEVRGNLVESGVLHPVPAGRAEGLQQVFGDVWEWTASAYLPYPGFRVSAGALGEYNGKFMSNQMVLRGGSCATPESHIRRTYRNFFPPDARWQFSGIRLAQDA